MRNLAQLQTYLKQKDDEIARLRAALEKYADRENWDEMGRQIEFTPKEDDIYDEDWKPWSIAQEALT